MVNAHILLSVAIMALVTMSTRFLPFVLFDRGETPAWVSYLGARLPYAMIGMLVIYALKGVTFESVGSFLPELIAGSIVVLSYVLSKNSLLGILFGTLTYMFLVQHVFVL